MRSSTTPARCEVTNEDPTIAPAGPEPGLSPENEARYMLGKAREFAKNGRSDLAIAKLNDVVEKYKGTRTAAEAKAALERSEKDLPLFPDRPVLEAEAPAKKAAPFKPPLPPPVVTVTPDQPRCHRGPGQARVAGQPVRGGRHPARIVSRAPLRLPPSRPVRSRRVSRRSSTRGSTSRAGRA